VPHSLFVFDKNFPGEQPASEPPVPYVRKCASCGHRGEERLPGDLHDGRRSGLLPFRLQMR
jgi:hypothetical protein